MERLTANVTARARPATLWGRDYLAANAVLIVPGVLPGSEGPLYYPAEEVTARPDDWNGFPLVGYHPQEGGRFKSARDPGVLEEQGLGWVFRANATDRLAAELWFDVEATRRFDARLGKEHRVLPRLLAGEPVELSTGLFLRQEAHEERVHNGRAYSRTARDYRPDHVAVLPDRPGACSLADGCGVLANQRLSHSDLRQRLEALLRARFGAPAAAQGGEYEGGGGEEEGEGGEENGEGGHGCLVVDVYDRTVVYRHQDRLWELGYTTDLRAGTAALRDESPAEVTRVTTYRPARNLLVANPKGRWQPPEAGAGAPEEVRRILRRVYSAWRDRNPAEDARTKARGARIAWGAVRRAGWQKGADGKWHKRRKAAMNENERRDAIQWLVANCDCWKGEGDADILGKLPDAKLSQLREAAEKAKAPPAPAANAAPQPAAPAAPEPPAQRLSPEELEDLAFARAEKNRQKQALVARLTANLAEGPARQAEAGWLMQKPLPELHRLASLVPETPAANAAWAPHYLGAAGAPPAPPVKDDSDNVLPVFNVDFGALAGDTPRQA